jgi:hypothetical protein
MAATAKIELETVLDRPIEHAAAHGLGTWIQCQMMGLSEEQYARRHRNRLRGVCFRS